MARRLPVLLFSLVLVLGIHLPVAAADDAPSRCGQINHATPVDQWIAGTIDSPTDVDWYRFSSLPKRQLVRYVLGELPADYRLDVYDRCGKFFSSHQYRPGVEFEEVIRDTYYAPYIPMYVRISGLTRVEPGAVSAAGDGLREWPEHSLQPNVCRRWYASHRG